MSAVEDRLAITELVYRCAEMFDAGDFDGVGELLSRAAFGGPPKASRVRVPVGLTSRIPVFAAGRREQHASRVLHPAWIPVATIFR